MKKIILFITLIITTFFSCKEQDTINLNELTVNGIVVIGKNKSVLISNFGQPYKIEKEFSKMDNIDMLIYKYKGAVFYVVKNLIKYYEITDNSYYLTKHNIKVGDNIEKLKDIYPLSYSKKSRTHLSLEIQKYDMYEIFHHNSTTKKITLIRTGHY